MTLQDYFAGQAMQALLTRQGAVDPKLIAKLAYEYADAMIEQWSQQS